MVGLFFVELLGTFLPHYYFGPSTPRKHFSEYYAGPHPRSSFTLWDDPLALVFVPAMAFVPVLFALGTTSRPAFWFASFLSLAILLYLVAMPLSTHSEPWVVYGPGFYLLLASALGQVVLLVKHKVNERRLLGSDY